MLSMMTRTFNCLGEDTGPKRVLWSTFLRVQVIQIYSLFIYSFPYYCTKSYYTPEWVILIQDLGDFHEQNQQNYLSLELEF